MKTKKRKTRKRIVTNIPPVNTDEELDKYLNRIGELDVEKRALQVKYDNAFQTLLEGLNKEKLPREKEEEIRATLVFRYSSMHRERLTEPTGQKTVHLPSGDIGWRFNGESAEISDPDKFLQYLIRKKIWRLIRFKEEINKEELEVYLKEGRKIRGARLVNHEEHFLKATQMEKGYRLKESELPRLLPSRAKAKITTSTK